MLSRFVFALILLASSALCYETGRSRGKIERAAVDKLSQPPLANWSPRAVTIATLGHRSVYEDFAAIWILQILGDRNLKSYSTAERVYESIIPVLRQKPRIEAIYILSCLIFSMEFDRSDYCEEINLLALNAFPKSWRILMTQGFIFSFKIGNKAKAAAFYGLASQQPNSPPWVQSLAQKLAASGSEDMSETLEMLKEIGGSEKLLEVISPRFKGQVPAPPVTPDKPPTAENATPEPQPSEEVQR